MELCKKNGLTIISKDADFSSKIILTNQPPKVVHLRIGNMKIKELHTFLKENWSKIEGLLKSNKLVNVYLNRIESIN